MDNRFSSLIRRSSNWRTLTFALFTIVGIVTFIGTGSATDLIIHLTDSAPLARETVMYKCDSAGRQIGVPADAFKVEYINGGGNSLVIVPIGGNSLVFSNVHSASGTKYTAQQYTWWEAKGMVRFYSDSLTGKLESSCRRYGTVNPK